MPLSKKIVEAIQKSNATNIEQNVVDAITAAGRTYQSLFTDKMLGSGESYFHISARCGDPQRHQLFVDIAKKLAPGWDADPLNSVSKRPSDLLQTAGLGRVVDAVREANVEFFKQDPTASYINLESQYESGKTVFHLLSDIEEQSKAEYITERLTRSLDNQLDVLSIKDNRGKTALDLAIENNRSGVFAALLAVQFDPGRVASTLEIEEKTGEELNKMTPEERRAYYAPFDQERKESQKRLGVAKWGVIQEIVRDDKLELIKVALTQLGLRTKTEVEDLDGGVKEVIVNRLAQLVVDAPSTEAIEIVLYDAANRLFAESNTDPEAPKTKEVFAGVYEVFHEAGVRGFNFVKQHNNMASDVHCVSLLELVANRVFPKGGLKTLLQVMGILDGSGNVIEGSFAIKDPGHPEVTGMISSENDAHLYGHVYGAVLDKALFETVAPNEPVQSSVTGGGTFSVEMQERAPAIEKMGLQQYLDANQYHYKVVQNPSLPDGRYQVRIYFQDDQYVALTQDLKNFKRDGFHYNLDLPLPNQSLLASLVRHGLHQLLSVVMGKVANENVNYELLAGLALEHAQAECFDILVEGKDLNWASKYKQQNLLQLAAAKGVRTAVEKILSADSGKALLHTDEQCFPHPLSCAVDGMKNDLAVAGDPDAVNLNYSSIIHLFLTKLREEFFADKDVVNVGVLTMLDLNAVVGALLELTPDPEIIKNLQFILIWVKKFGKELKLEDKHQKNVATKLDSEPHGIIREFQQRPNNWTDAHQAVASGDLELVRFVVDTGSQHAVTQDGLGKLPVDYAVESNDAELVKYMLRLLQQSETAELESSSDTDKVKKQYQDRYQRIVSQMPLAMFADIVAEDESNRETDDYVRLIDLQATNSAGRSMLAMLIAENKHEHLQAALGELAKRNNTPEAWDGVRNAIDGMYYEGDNQVFALAVAAEKGYEQVFDVLFGRNGSHKFAELVPNLEQFAQRGDVEQSLAEILIRSKVDPVVIARWLYALTILTKGRLLEGPYGDSLLVTVLEGDDRPELIAALHLATKHSSVNATFEYDKPLLPTVEKEIPLNLHIAGLNVLQYACVVGHVGIVKSFLGLHGDDVNHLNIDLNADNTESLFAPVAEDYLHAGKNPLQLAAEFGHLEICHLLVSKNAVNKDQTDAKGQTYLNVVGKHSYREEILYTNPLHYAAKLGHLEGIKHFFENDITKVYFSVQLTQRLPAIQDDKVSFLPHEYAVVSGRVDVLAYLIDQKPSLLAASDWRRCAMLVNRAPQEQQADMLQYILGRLHQLQSNQQDEFTRENPGIEPGPSRFKLTESQVMLMLHEWFNPKSEVAPGICFAAVDVLMQDEEIYCPTASLDAIDSLEETLRVLRSQADTGKAQELVRAAIVEVRGGYQESVSTGIFSTIKKYWNEKVFKTGGDGFLVEIEGSDARKTRMNDLRDYISGQTAYGLKEAAKHGLAELVPSILDYATVDAAHKDHMRDAFNEAVKQKSPDVLISLLRYDISRGFEVFDLAFLSDKITDDNYSAEVSDLIKIVALYQCRQLIINQLNALEDNKDRKSGWFFDEVKKLTDQGRNIFAAYQQVDELILSGNLPKDAPKDVARDWHASELTKAAKDWVSYVRNIAHAIELFNSKDGSKIGAADHLVQVFTKNLRPRQPINDALKDLGHNKRIRRAMRNYLRPVAELMQRCSSLNGKSELLCAKLGITDTVFIHQLKPRVLADNYDQLQRDLIGRRVQAELQEKESKREQKRFERSQRRISKQLDKGSKLGNSKVAPDSPILASRDDADLSSDEDNTPERERLLSNT